MIILIFPYFWRLSCNSLRVKPLLCSTSLPLCIKIIFWRGILSWILKNLIIWLSLLWPDYSWELLLEFTIPEWVTVPMQRCSFRIWNNLLLFHRIIILWKSLRHSYHKLIKQIVLQELSLLSLIVCIFLVTSWNVQTQIIGILILLAERIIIIKIVVLSKCSWLIIHFELDIIDIIVWLRNEELLEGIVLLGFTLSLQKIKKIE